MFMVFGGIAPFSHHKKLDFMEIIVWRTKTVLSREGCVVFACVKPVRLDRRFIWFIWYILITNVQ
jgi:hypothetical protein